MTISRGKTATVVFALLMILAMAVSLFALPAEKQTATAQSTKQSYAFIGATPNPVGVGQEVLLHIGITAQLNIVGDSYKELSVTIERPDGQTDKIEHIETDATGGTGRTYTPTMEGSYYIQTHFPAQWYNYSDYWGATVSTWFKASDSEKLELVVQADPIPYYPGTALPTEYWTRPINAQFHEWANITGNWLKPAGSYTMPPIPKYHPYNDDAPENAHILWTTQLIQGGIVGGELGAYQYEMGDAYEGFYLGSVIINGVLYYNKYNADGGSDVEQDVVAVDLKTGEELWVKNWNNSRLAFGQIFYWDSYNYHAAFDYLWIEDGTTWHAFDALTGRWEYSMTNVPSGWNLYGEKGEIYRYTVDLTNGWITLWNSSRVGASGGSWGSAVVGQTLDARDGIEWNETIKTTTPLPGSVCHYFLNDRIFGSTAGGMGVEDTTIINWAISVKPGDEGRVIFNNPWTRPEGNMTTVWTDASPEDGIFILSVKENLRYYGFSLESGNFIWESDPEMYLAQYDKWYGPAYGYGKFYTGRQSGVVTCYNITTGKTLWKYDVKDKYAEILWSNNWPIGFHFLADGKIYLSYMEHSPINPNGRGAPFVCLNATTGEEIWELNWAGTFWGGHAIIGDSIIAGYNAYDGRIYAIGKGPSATSVAASPKISVDGDNILVEGMVTDISPGTKEYALTARFPNGVPAVSVANMSAWMEYVYMQKARPADVVGVDVVISVLDPNGNSYEVGTTTSDASGYFSAVFAPLVPGKYTVIATFEGSGAYYGSFAETAINVESAPAATVEPTASPASAADLYFMPVSAGMIVAIVVVLALLILMFRKR
jgi:outer membrane protein assembly factor BamB